MVGLSEHHLEANVKNLLVIGGVLAGVVLLSTSTTSEVPVKPHALRVRVIDIRTERVKATVNVPMGFVRLGLRLGKRYAPELADLDAAEVMEIIEQGGNGKIVDVTDEDRGERVEIYAE
jgi:hypothetical protein